MEKLSAEEQLDQLTSYLDAHYEEPDFTPPWKGGAGDPQPADNYCAKLPDRISHAAMLVLGSAVDHSMPGVAYTREVETRELAELGAVQFTGPNPDGARWVIALHSGGWWRGSGQALEMQWRPEVAAVAQLSGAIVVDVDYPLAPEYTVAEMHAAVERAIDYARGEGARTVTVWGYSSGAALAALSADRADELVLTYPDFGALDALPDELRAGFELSARLPRTLLQVATHDEVADTPELLAAELTTREYVSRHRVSTPEVARQRVKDIADYLRL